MCPLSDLMVFGCRQLHSFCCNQPRIKLAPFNVRFCRLHNDPCSPLSNPFLALQKPSGASSILLWRWPLNEKRRASSAASVCEEVVAKRAAGRSTARPSQRMTPSGHCPRDLPHCVHSATALSQNSGTVLGGTKAVRFVALRKLIGR